MGEGEQHPVTLNGSYMHVIYLMITLLADNCVGGIMWFRYFNNALLCYNLSMSSSKILIKCSHVLSFLLNV